MLSAHDIWYLFVAWNLSQNYAWLWRKSSTVTMKNAVWKAGREPQQKEWLGEGQMEWRGKISRRNEQGERKRRQLKKWKGELSSECTKCKTTYRISWMKGLLKKSTSVSCLFNGMETVNLWRRWRGVRKKLLAEGWEHDVLLKPNKIWRPFKQCRGHRLTVVIA